MADLRLKVPFTLIITGSSGCGKTTIVEKLITQAQCFSEPIGEVVWIYTKDASNEPLFNRLKQHLNISFFEGIPEAEIENNTLFGDSRNKLIIFDDIFNEIHRNSALFSLFNVKSHHHRISVIVTVQNLLCCTPLQKSALNTLLRSCSYLVTFVNRRTLPVVTSLAKSYFPGETYRVLQPFNTILSESQPYKYLMIDFVTLDDLMLVRSGGLIPEHPCYIYKDEEAKSGKNVRQRPQERKETVESADS